MSTSFEQLMELFQKTAELRSLIQNNPEQWETLQPALTPAVEVILNQFNKEGSQEEFKTNILKSLNSFFKERIDNFFDDVNALAEFTKKK